MKYRARIMLCAIESIALPYWTVDQALDRIRAVCMVCESPTAWGDAVEVCSMHMPTDAIALGVPQQIAARALLAWLDHEFIGRNLFALSVGAMGLGVPKHLALEAAAAANGEPR